jgi:hypothetical protein
MGSDRLERGQRMGGFQANRAKQRHHQSDNDHHFAHTRLSDSIEYD